MRKLFARGAGMETHVVNDLGGNISLDVGRRLDDSLHVGLSDSGGLSLLDGLGRSVGHGIRASVDISLSLGLSCSHSVLDNLGLVDDFGGDPDAGGGDNLHRGEDFGCGLEVGFDLGRCLMDSDGSGHDLHLSLRSIMSDEGKARGANGSGTSVTWLVTVTV